MEQTDRERIAERVRKMLNLANDPGASDGERDNALRMAHATMAKYNLDASDVTDKAAAPAKRGNVKAQFYGPPWARYVAQAAARLLWCEYVFTSSSQVEAIPGIVPGAASVSVESINLKEHLICQTQ